MYRTTLANVGASRTCSPLYEKHQATPMPFFLSAAGLAQEIYSGMVLARDGEGTVRLADADDTSVLGLAALDHNNVIDDLDGLSDVPFAVWVGGPDAMFEVYAPAFDDTQVYAVPVNGTRVTLRSNANGQLTSAAGTGPDVAELIEVVSDNRLIVRLLPR